MERWASLPIVWGAATLMVTIVSCCSLIGLSIVPLISGTSYKTFNNFFTGLAVGSLTGSAIFGLIPQAFGLPPTDKDKSDKDKSYLYKSMIIFIGIYLFYCSERLMRLYFQTKTHNQSKNSHQKGDKDVTTSNTQGLVDESAGDPPESNCQNDLVPMTEISLEKVDDAKIGHQHHNALNSHDLIARALKGDSSINTMVNKKIIAPVAWMIIIGDGLHNFIDGLSIGASFIVSWNNGFTNSLAVIFEELPHELGDFAVLIASGMTVRQAVLFNFLSACTCYIGMVAGLLLGDLTSSASFIFALAGGMFLYISLVDMMGELSAMLEEAKDSPKETVHLLLMQNLGILLGIVIIFVLSFYA